MTWPEVANRAILKLTSAQFLMSIMLTAAVCYGFIRGIVSADAFLPLVGMAVTMYFNRDRSTHT